MSELNLFEKRKADHMKYAMEKASDVSLNLSDQIQLSHEALPDLNWDQIQTRVQHPIFGEIETCFVSSMTGGFEKSLEVNSILAGVCEKNQMLLGVGSQRRELTDEAAKKEWQLIKEKHPQVKLLSNIGVSQLKDHKTSEIYELVKNIQAEALIIHLNPLQEVIQDEGTPQFLGTLDLIKKCIDETPCPVILKETGCGFSKATLERLKGIGLLAVDVAGFGGTHWGRVEGMRSDENHRKSASGVFAHWGMSTAQSLEAASALDLDFEIWSSGGIRTGLDVAISVAMGATLCGLARPFMQNALESSEALQGFVEELHFQYKTALFCTGSKDSQTLTEKGQWQWVK